MAGDVVFQIVKVANMAAGAFVAFVGVYMILTLDFFNGDRLWFSILTFFLPFFYVLFGLLIIAAEFFKGFVNTYFSFLRYFLGRGLFNIFLATQTGSMGGNLGQIFGYILLVLGVIYIFLHFIQASLSGEVREKLLA